MLERLCLNPEIGRFLSNFPKHLWEKSLEVTLLLGIRGLAVTHPTGLSFSQLIKHSAKPIQNPSARKPARSTPKHLQTASLRTLPPQPPEVRRSECADLTVRKRLRPAVSHSRLAGSCGSVLQSGNDNILHIDSYVATREGSEENAIHIADEFLRNPFSMSSHVFRPTT